MRKLFMTLAVLAVGTIAFGQRLQVGEIQANAGLGLNSGSWSTPFYVGVDYGIYPDITVGGNLGYATHTYDYGNGFSNKGTWLSIVARGDYHFNTVLDIPNQWDLYAGLSLAYNNFSYKSEWSTGYGDFDSSGVGLGLQIGGRYYFTDQWAVNVEFGGGNIVSGGKIGITYKF